MTLQPGKQLQYTHCQIFQKVKTMKFGQFIEYNLRNIFFEKLCTKSSEESIPRLFSKKIKTEHISSSIVWNSVKFAFIVCPSQWLLNILKLMYWQLTFTICKAYLKNKKRSGTSLPVSFSAWFLKKNISYSINCPNVIV